MKLIRTEPGRTREAAEEAGAVVRAGGLIVFPAERLYGIGADARNSEAVRRVFELKGRPARTPLPVIVSDREEAEKWVVAPAAARVLMERFWPGPLTLVLEARPGLAPEVMAGSGRLGIRAPGNELARLIARAAGGPVTATSANPSGGDDCRDLAELAAGLDEFIDLALDAGPLAGPPGSTVILVRDREVKILREGAVARDRVREALEGVELT